MTLEDAPNMPVTQDLVPSTWTDLTDGELDDFANNAETFCTSDASDGSSVEGDYADSDEFGGDTDEMDPPPNLGLDGLPRDDGNSTDEGDGNLDYDMYEVNGVVVLDKDGRPLSVSGTIGG